ncbi:MAG: D-aminoacyl-tRNA deacylase [Candidatus Omnitrophota bacterium]|nr:D-tyrosyl-tRNA(Tyr) deacylase [Candidatus Omnitrophota bacterium]
MKVVIQRVTDAYVLSPEKEKEEIGKGLVLLVGVGKTDGSAAARSLAEKISKMRVFGDDKGKMNLDISQVAGEILSVPQFTLMARTDKGNRPGFDEAALPEKAEGIWRAFNESLRNRGIAVKEGFFGKYMEICLKNDGPVTFVVEEVGDE